MYIYIYVYIPRRTGKYMNIVFKSLTLHICLTQSHKYGTTWHPGPLRGGVRRYTRGSKQIIAYSYYTDMILYDCGHIDSRRCTRGMSLIHSFSALLTPKRCPRRVRCRCKPNLKTLASSTEVHLLRTETSEPRRLTGRSPRRTASRSSSGT